MVRQLQEALMVCLECNKSCSVCVWQTNTISLSVITANRKYATFADSSVPNRKMV